MANKKLDYIGTFAGIKASQPAREAKAATKRIYCKCTQSWWTTAGAAIGFSTFGGSGEAIAWPGERMTPVATDTGVWYIDVDPSVHSKLIFTRINGSGTVENWGAQTEDLDYPNGDNNLYTITSTTAQWTSQGHKVEGSWSTYVPPAVESVYKVSVNSGTPVTLTKGTDKYTGSVSVAKGDVLSFTKDDEPFEVVGENNRGNNVTVDLEVRTAGTCTIWLDVANGVLWLDGFVGENYYLYAGLNGYESAYAYTYSDETLGNWHGTEMENATMVNFDGYALYRVQVNTGHNASKIIFNDGDKQQTADLNFATSSAYYRMDAAAGNAGDANKALAAELVFDINSARNATGGESAHGGYSICDIPVSTMEDFVDRYNALSANASAKAVFDAATVYTHKADKSEGSEDITFKAIIDQFVIEIEKANGGSGNNVLRTVNNSYYIPVTVIVVSSIAIVSLLGAGLMIKRRKEDR